MSSLVTQACDPSGDNKVMGYCPDLPGTVTSEPPTRPLVSRFQWTIAFGKSVGFTKIPHISRWVDLKIAKGDAVEIVDPNSDLAARRKPNMSQLVMELNECLALEMARAR
ncbi:hypothetical protein Bca52824_081392 [Brassica carinata]|uniref:Uncharacterized protein n=1 Tax=Brassica carinata TaxID=52824 RepID=A0A8X7TT74_BRACI|nr:hypothetical protein Bca52824_081392 [Brassica carinata]